MKKRVVIIEDNASIRASFAQVIALEGSYEIVGAYGSCEHALEKLSSDRADVYLMDIGLPGIDGIEGTLRIKKLLPEVTVLIITVQEDSQRVFRSLCAGADGYIVKETGTLELIKAIGEALAGGAPMSLQIAKMVVQSFKRNPSSPLSDREREVLQGISEGKSYTKIAADLFISRETVKSHIKNIYHKLSVGSKAEALKIAAENRWINR